MKRFRFALGVLAVALLVAATVLFAWHGEFPPFVIRHVDKPIYSRGQHYSDPSRQQRLKDLLQAAGVPFTVEIEQDGKEFVRWKAEHDAVAEPIRRKVSDYPGPGTRNAHLPDAALQAEFIAWLRAKGIKHEVVPMHEKEWVVWDEKAGDLVRQFMTQRSSQDCKKSC